MTSGTRWTASPACLTTVLATRLARATGDCFFDRFRPPERLRPDDFFVVDLRELFRRPPDLRADDFFAADFFRPLDFRPPRRPPERALPRDDRFFVAMVLHSTLRVGCSQVSARIAQALHPSAARVNHHTHNIAHPLAECEGVTQEIFRCEAIVSCVTRPVAARSASAIASRHGPAARDSPVGATLDSMPPSYVVAARATVHP